MNSRHVTVLGRLRSVGAPEKEGAEVLDGAWHCLDHGDGGPAMAGDLVERRDRTPRVSTR